PREPDPDHLAAYRATRRSLPKRLFRRIYPWLSVDALDRIDRYKRIALQLRPGRPSPWRLGINAARMTYGHLVARWLNPDARPRLRAVKHGLLRRVGRPVSPPPDVLLPTSRLTLSGLVYTSIFNLHDHRKNYEAMLSAFVAAFRDRPDV